MLKLLVSYYSAPSIQAARSCRSPIKQDDDDLAPAPHHILAQPQFRGQQRGLREYSPRTTTSMSSVDTNVHVLGTGSGGGKSTQNSSTTPITWAVATGEMGLVRVDCRQARTETAASGRAANRIDYGCGGSGSRCR